MNDKQRAVGAYVAGACGTGGILAAMAGLAVATRSQVENSVAFGSFMVMLGIGGVMISIHRLRRVGGWTR